MKTIFMSLMLFLALESLSSAQSLEEFQRGFTEDCVRLGQERDQDLDKMAANYINALRDLGEKAKQSGNLDAVLPVRDEIAAVEAAKWPLPLLSKTAPKRLRELRDTYIEERGKLEKEHSRRLSELVARTTELLKQREVELTKAGDVDGAIAAREMARLISSDAMLQRVKDAAKNGMLETASVKDSGLSYPILRLQPGALIFTNRNYAFEKIPKQLENCSFVQTPIARPNTVAIEVVSSGLLYLASSTYKDSHRKWLDDLLSNGWNLCDFKIGMAYGHSPMIVLSKWYKEGKVEVPLLGPGGGSTLIFVQAKVADDISKNPAVKMPIQGTRAGQECDLEIAPGVRMKFCWIPPGKFLMGSPPGQKDGVLGEGPQREVELTKGFWLGKYEVTQGQWQGLKGMNPSDLKTGADLPANDLTWTEIQEALSRANQGMQSSGWRLDLPTEAQWEYACRAGTKGDYAGDLDRMAWYAKNASRTTHVVGLKQANAWGLHDMHGNVWEWCRDWLQDGYEGLSTVDPCGPDNGVHRIRRGGSWFNIDKHCRSAMRHRDLPTRPTCGFRIAIVPAN